MTRGRLFAAAAALAVFVASTPAVNGQALQRSIYVSVLDAAGVPVPDLGPADFIVREDNVAREVLSVVPASDPMEIALLIDNSEAAEPYIRDYREALPAFINAIAADETKAKHQVAIITLAERPTINTNYTLDLGLAIRGAQRIFPVSNSGCYLLDGLIETSRGIAKRGTSRPVIVAIDTEGPELSGRDHGTVREALRSSGAAFHAVVVGNPVNNSNDRLMVLSLGTRETGGRNDNVLTGNALTERLKRVAAELTHQYRVTYARPRTLIPPEEVTVSGTNPKLTVRGTPVKEPRESR